ncbi:microtubule-associated protein tau-like [Watersipora subatra]|uniref:microtubule-associated protein tau-like n=1 Tax=Watersipora subatra TaxID=2589382 RepID=UPI00355C770F
MNSMYNDVFRREGTTITYVRHYAKDDSRIVVRNHQIDSDAKIGSLDNYDHQPGGGDIKILHKPLDVSFVKSKVGSLDNSKHIAKGGKRKIPHFELNWDAKSKIGSLDNIDHQPAGGNVRLAFHEKPRWTSIAKVGSLDNIDYVPGRSFRTLQDYMSPFRQKLLNRPNVIWTEGYNQKTVSYPSNRLKPLTSLSNPTN